MTNYDKQHCHKWALLLIERKRKLDQAQAAIDAENFDVAKQLVNQIFYGVMGKQADPGMAGSLLYHMAMVSKMKTETIILLKELNINQFDVQKNLEHFYGLFEEDAHALLKGVVDFKMDISSAAVAEWLNSEQKVVIFSKLAKNYKTIENQLINQNYAARAALVDLFQEWATLIIKMRFTQEYETIKGMLILNVLVNTFGVEKIQNVMNAVKDTFGQETVNIALDVTLKVGMRREKLQAVMLSDHYINNAMSIETLDGQMDFLNCPIYGSHQYIAKTLGINSAVTMLFCKNFCFSHAKAMLETVMPFPLTLWQPKIMTSDGVCSFYLKLAYSPMAQQGEQFVPLILSWNVTRECNLKCSHCYINAADGKLANELSTEEGKRLIDQICQVSQPLLVLSGGEPLLRSDIYELIQYGSSKGLKMGLGSNGSLIDAVVAKKLKQAGITTVSISLDSHIAAQHDDFRGVTGSWDKAVNAIKVLRENDVLVQVNTTLTHDNYYQIDDIMSFVESIGVENFHLFFLVPTGRGVMLNDISPQKYETMITTAFSKVPTHRLNVRPSCAPQFMRIAQGMGLDMRQWIRGCIAGMYYCRIYPNGDITPCPYLPIKIGTVREKSFKEIWQNANMFKDLRDPNTLTGKCGLCNYKKLCGGCRARAYGLSADFIDYCGDLHVPAEVKGDYLKEDPWCVYQPDVAKNVNMCRAHPHNIPKH
ncbi:MAG: radical SAM protein [Candidatus Bathyarchaeota archaeon]|uniref:radical SAM/SPASM domain-containing protein n=1 Tax=Candidatus Bathycorpusculum sp. TaxID=2994959 RepID=UPI0028234FDD|nr:radical SAM protein [Candidatus Termiticorpusculum sp.]MCL2258087.1 radical SAM protein [Candidatus Termiticorpusculum sp.]MCL2291551.1 radical SAM protein [Candidatus Termiticorpusculum sp.]